MLQSNRKLRDALSRQDRGVGKSSGISGVLSSLFIDCCCAVGVNPMKWNYLMEEYIQRQVGLDSSVNNRRDRASIRGNLRKEFLKPTMTWKVFCKSMMFLKIRRFKIVIIAEHENGLVTEHSTVVEYAMVDRKTDVSLLEEMSAGEGGAES